MDLVQVSVSMDNQLGDLSRCKVVVPIISHRCLQAIAKQTVEGKRILQVYILYVYTLYYTLTI
jgi:hypothetical protein